MAPSFFKRNGIVLLTLGAYAASVVGIAAMIDALVYQDRKREILFDYSPDQIFPGEFDRLASLAEQWRDESILGGDEDAALDQFRAEAKQILQGATSIYRITLDSSRGESLFDEQVPKFRRFNDLSNSLWLMNFSTRRGRPLSHPNPTQDTFGTYLVYFTTPASLPPSVESEIKELTTRFRWLTLIITAALTLLTLALGRWILLPTRNVIDSIESSDAHRMRFIARPSTRLESLYNVMARDAVLARLLERLNDRISQGEALSGWELVTMAGDYLAQQQAVLLAVAVEMSEEGPGRLRPTGRNKVSRIGAASDPARDETLCESVARSAGGRHLGGDELPGAAGVLQGGDAELGPAGATQLLADPGRPGIHYALALGLGDRFHRAQTEPSTDLLQRVAAALGRVMDTLQSRNQSLVRERGRASMNLSRNLGHDLTNIIATSKLELMTLQALVGPNAPPVQGERREILNDSLVGLLDSTKFLQEVVNLYRAYAFLKQPILETHDLNELVSETIRLFRLSTSEGVKFVESLDPSSPKCRVDPRLIKLALFNLFSNATHAIRTGHDQEGGQGTITLCTGRSKEGGVEISVHDSGAGVLNDSGELASPEDVEGIFTLGYSRGKDSEGEGLGLHWVRTIIQDVHDGSIRAENAPDGGARFTLVFPPIEPAPEARTPEARTAELD